MNRNYIAALAVIGVFVVITFTSSGSAKIASTPQITQTISKEPSLLPKVVDQVTSINNIEVKVLNTNNSAIIQLNDVVTPESVDRTIEQMKGANRQGVKLIYLLLDSPGGSVSDGARLITAMDNSKAPVYTVCTEICASMASHILEHGTKRYMIDRTRLLFHPASLEANMSGEVDKIYSRLGSMKNFIDKFDMYVAKRSGQKFEDYKAKSMREYWVDAEDALHDGLIDGIVSIDFVKNVVPISILGNKLQQQINGLRWE